MTWNGKKAEAEIAKLEHQIGVHQGTKAVADRGIAKLQKRIEEIESGETPIQPGSIITWEKGTGDRIRFKRGRVISVSPCKGYERKTGFRYRVCILSVRGKEIGFADINDGDEPMIEVKKKPAKKPVTVKSIGRSNATTK